MSENDDDSEIEVKYDPETGTYRDLYKSDEPGSLAGTVIFLVSVATGKDLNTMDPLYETVDFDALESLFRSREGQTAHIKFQYCGCTVTAMSDGEVVVTPPVDDE